MWFFQRFIWMIGYLNIHTAISLLLLPCYVGHRGIFEASDLLGFPQNTGPDSFLLLDSTNHGHYSQLRWEGQGQSFFTETPSIFKLYAIFSFPPFFSLWGLHLLLYFSPKSFFVILISCFEIFRAFMFDIKMPFCKKGSTSESHTAYCYESLVSLSLKYFSPHPRFSWLIFLKMSLVVL